MWSKWANEAALTEMLSKLSRMQSEAMHLLSLEREITEEIRLLADLNIYPSAELAIIRKENKALKEKQSVSNDAEKIVDETIEEETLGAEIIFCERKLELLRQRRFKVIHTINYYFFTLALFILKAGRRGE
jgi:hypothetical protein